MAAVLPCLVFVVPLSHCVAVCCVVCMSRLFARYGQPQSTVFVERCGSQATLDVIPGGWHSVQLMAGHLQEADMAVDNIAEFLK